MQAKDLIDIWIIWRENNPIDLREMFTASQSKTVGMYLPEIARLISIFPNRELNQIKFVKK
ncbi:hypothetical protein KA977_14915 [Candidatus Dependentiae bacterium]|nr:hypothetical protein [Candidatus Dependentiae bacterium]